MDALLGFAPFAFVLLCPLMMLLMMWGMHSGHGRKEQAAHGGSAGGGDVDPLRHEVATLRTEAGNRR